MHDNQNCIHYRHRLSESCSCWRLSLRQSETCDDRKYELNGNVEKYQLHPDRLNSVHGHRKEPILPLQHHVHHEPNEKASQKSQQDHFLTRTSATCRFDLRFIIHFSCDRSLPTKSGKSEVNQTVCEISLIQTTKSATRIYGKPTNHQRYHT